MENNLHLFLPEKPNYLNDFIESACFYLDLYRYKGELIVYYERELPDGNHGQCWGDSKRVELSIAHRSMGEGIGRKGKMLAAAHELVHAQQYLSGRLKDRGMDSKGYKMLWNRKEIIWRDDSSINSQPWEEEAYSREEEIYKSCFNPQG